MKKLFIILFACALVSCSKSKGPQCYECEISLVGKRTVCIEDGQQLPTYTDQNGNDLPMKCKKK